MRRSPAEPIPPAIPAPRRLLLPLFLLSLIALQLAPSAAAGPIDLFCEETYVGQVTCTTNDILCDAACEFVNSLGEEARKLLADPIGYISNLVFGAIAAVVRFVIDTFTYVLVLIITGPARLAQYFYGVLFGPVFAGIRIFLDAIYTGDPGDPGLFDHFFASLLSLNDTLVEGLSALGPFSVPLLAASYAGLAFGGFYLAGLIVRALRARIGGV